MSKDPSDKLRVAAKPDHKIGQIRMGPKLLTYVIVFTHARLVWLNDPLKPTPKECG